MAEHTCGFCGRSIAPVDAQLSGLCSRCKAEHDRATDVRNPAVRHRMLAYASRVLLLALGRDPDTDHDVAETPRRFADAWMEFIDYDPGKLDTAFEARQADQLVVVSGIRVWSVCEHHLLPFWCDVTVGYLPRGKVLGLSKFARVAQKHAHRLQVQERLVEGVADEVAELTGSPHVAVLARGEHLCMTMRGVSTPARMTTEVLRGEFRDDGATRAEFMRLALA